MWKDQLALLETEVSNIKQELHEIKESLKLEHSNSSYVSEEMGVGIGKMIGRNFFKRKSLNSAMELSNLSYQMLSNIGIVSNKQIFNQVFKTISYAHNSSSEKPSSFAKIER